LNASDSTYRCEFFGPDHLYRVSTQGGETLVDVVEGFAYQPLRTITGEGSHALGVEFVLGLLAEEERAVAKTGGSTVDLSRRLERMHITLDDVMAIPMRDARAARIEYRVRYGFEAQPRPLLGANHKLELSSGEKVLTTGLSLLPHTLSGAWNTCRWAGSCVKTCLEGAGQGGLSDMPNRARGWKTAMLAEMPLHFLRLLVHEVDGLIRMVPAKRADGWMVALRLNVFSDLRWELIAPWLISRATDGGVSVYDYTKGRGHRDEVLCSSLGYDLSFSVDERTSDEQARVMRRPVVVFACRVGQLPATWMGRPVVDGDVSDARFLDSPDAVVGLAYKRVTRRGAGAVSVQMADAVASGFVRSVA
jgi:hypothetical protein